MAELLLITGPRASDGFKLGGFEVKELDEGSDVDEVMEEVASADKYGLVCMEERFFEKISERVIKRIRKKGLPVILSMEIPEKWGETSGGESHIARLIRRAIGYQINIKK